MARHGLSHNVKFSVGRAIGWRDDPGLDPCLLHDAFIPQRPALNNLRHLLSTKARKSQFHPFRRPVACLSKSFPLIYFSVFTIGVRRILPC